MGRKSFAILRLCPVAVAGTASCGPQPIRRAASGVSDRINAAAMPSMPSMHSAARARRTSPTGPRRSSSEACKKQCFSLGSGGVRAETLKLPARRTAALVGASWRRLVGPARKLHYFWSSPGAPRRAAAGRRFRAKTLKLPARRTVASGCASWRRLVRPARTLHYFWPPRRGGSMGRR